MAAVNLGMFYHPSFHTSLLTRYFQALLGTGLTMADGVLTASVSVTSAVGGIGEYLERRRLHLTANLLL